MNKIINWMGGWPKDGLVSASDWEERLAAAAERVRQGGAVSTRPSSQGGLKEVLVRGLLKDKTNGKTGRLRMARGADAVLARLTEGAMRPGDLVLTERLTSRSALQMFRKAGIRVEVVEGDSGGMDAEALRASIALYRPRLVYIAPACSDPEGVSWERARTTAVIEICRQGGVTVVRDDRQEMLLYEESEEGRKLRLEPVTEGVISLGQLPPGLVAGLKFGWMAGDPAALRVWFPSASGREERSNYEVNALERQALLDLLQEQPLEPLLDLLRVQSGERMRRLTALLRQRHVPRLSWRTPAGGVHLWLTLPEGLDGETLLRGAWLKGLMFQPGAPFFAGLPQRNTLRLTFAYADERQMKLGVARLLDTMGDFLGRFDIS